MTTNHSGDILIKSPENHDFPWDEFDPDAYWADNYRTLLKPDREIIEYIRDFFADIRDVYNADGIDVGSGPNLYPALAMLPLCKTITLWEYSAANVRWLERHVGGYQESWDAFWDVLRKRSRYARLGDPKKVLAERVRIHKGNIFRLPRERWQVGTMFFVAESITSAKLEFDRAIRRFLGALRPGSPFAIALMENSDGYRVGSHFFPALKVDTEIVKRKLKPHAPGVVVRHIDSEGLLREGQTGMILAYGRLRK